ncbi:unnamed protein product [Ectocarpus sp. 4 AP-2014]
MFRRSHPASKLTNTELKKLGKTATLQQQKVFIFFESSSSRTLLSRRFFLQLMQGETPLLLQLFVLPPLSRGLPSSNALLPMPLLPPPSPPACPQRKEQLFLMVDNCTLDMQRGQDTSSQLADAINGYPNATM